MNSTTKIALDISFENVTEIWIKSGENIWVWNPDRTVETLGGGEGPHHISRFLDDSDGDHWYLFGMPAGNFSVHDLVRGDSFEDAYESYIDWAAENRCIKIEKEDYEDYGVEGDSPTCGFTSDGVPVDTESIRGEQVRLHKVVCA